MFPANVIIMMGNLISLEKHVELSCFVVGSDSWNTEVFCFSSISSEILFKFTAAHIKHQIYYGMVQFLLVSTRGLLL